MKNPIKAAHAILEHSRIPSALGRIPPMFVDIQLSSTRKKDLASSRRTLVSDGAHQFAASRGIETVPPKSLVSPRANADWEKWKHRLESSDTLEDSFGSESSEMQDTVGAVAWDNDARLAAGVSRLVISMVCSVKYCLTFEQRWSTVKALGPHRRGIHTCFTRGIC